VAFFTRNSVKSVTRHQPPLDTKLRLQTVFVPGRTASALAYRLPIPELDKPGSIAKPDVVFGGVR
jgi:hypothetical protein